MAKNSVNMWKYDKRKGGEFVNEFWRVLPGLLKDFYENGGQDGKKVVARLIGIWDERKVFGTRSESLKDILGDNPPALNNNSTTSNPTSKPSSVSKSSQRDSSPIIKKLTVSGMPEKIITAYQSVLDQYFDEDTALNKYIQQALSLISNLQEQEAILKQCIEQLESVDAARITLISNLKEALSEEEKKSELLRHQLQQLAAHAACVTMAPQSGLSALETHCNGAAIRSIPNLHCRLLLSRLIRHTRGVCRPGLNAAVARAEAEHAVQLRQRFGGAHAINVAWSSSSTLMTTIPSEQTAAMMQNAAISPISPQFQPPHPAIPLSATASAADDEPKKTAAAMADKLASLASPEQVLSSILASLAAEQAASMNGGSPSVELSEGPPGFQIPKRPRIENPTQTGDMGAPPFFGQLLQAQQNGAAPTSLGGMQSSMQANQAPGAFAPPPPPLPPMLPPLLQQFSQNGGGMFGMGPFGMLASSMPPPLPNMLPPGFPRPSGPPPPPPLSPAQNQSQTQQQQQQQQSPQAPQQSPTSTGFFPTPGIGFFPPVQMQQSPSVQRQ
uniref:Uncharacterized protein n=1 Tax=Aegilops tauschii TaxID=37682 RepID=M8C746_AEGTA